MIKSKWLALVTCLLVIVGCSSTNPIKVDFDKNTNVETVHYKSFSWLTKGKILSMPAGMNPIMKVRIDEEIENAFKAKGFVLVDDAETADFSISYTVGSRDKIKINSFPSTYHAGYGRWGRGYYGSVHTTETTVRQYTEGMIAIDVYDVKTHQPAWHGVAKKRLSSNDKDNPVETIRKVINEVVSTFH